MARRRQVSDEEQALWQAVIRSVRPLKPRRPARKADVAGMPPPPANEARQPPPKPSLVAKRVPKEAALAPIDRRARQQLARGTRPIDARLDLHGHTQSEAHTVLTQFLRRAQRNGAKTVLVITGKGGRDGERGVLKRQVPLWLSLPEFRALVIGFSAAAVGHGGEGALYVRVRRG